jgi:hypothetical protein
VYKSDLPVVTQEISDTWIQGIASDPRKSAEYRAVSRVLSNCVFSGQWRDIVWICICICIL